MALPADFFYFVRDPTTGDISIYRTPAIPVLTPTALAQQGVTITSRRPCIVRFLGETFVVGCYSRPVYYPTRDPVWVPVAIKPPDVPITVTASGSGELRGIGLCYITYQHRVGDVLLAESNPSNVVQVDLFGKASRNWANLASSRHEKRVTHVAGYCSVNGSNYRRAFLMPYGASAYSEGVPEASLTIEGPSSNYLPPAGVAFAVAFDNRIFYANTSEYPYRFWFSAAGNGQYVDLASFRDTLDRDAITGMGACQGVLVILTLEKAYAVRRSGSGGTNYVVERLDSSFGGLSHHAIVELHNKLWFPTQDGIAMYDGGAFRFLMKDLRPYYQADYLEHQQEFLNSFAVNDKIGKNYVLIVPRERRDTFEDWQPGHVAYVGNYLNFEPSMGGTGEQPDWSVDLRNRLEFAAFYGLDNRLYYGGEDGRIRVEDPTDGPDDFDTLQKPLLIEHGAQLFGEPGDDIEMGKTVEQLWVYMESETTAWTLYVMMGDEFAGQQFQPDNTLNNWKLDVAASAQQDVQADPAGGEMGQSYIQETVHFTEPQGVAGRALVTRIRALAPVGLKYRGHGGAWAPGPAPRKAKDITRMELLADSVPQPVNAFATIPALANTLFQVQLDNSDLASYPIAITYAWTGAFVAGAGDSIVSPALLSTGHHFDVAPGASVLTVTVILNGSVTLVNTYYFNAS